MFISEHGEMFARKMRNINNLNFEGAMGKFSHTQITKKISRYVNGKLSKEEIDELWAEIIRDEYYLNYLKTVVNLKKLIEEKNDRSPIIN